MQSTTRKSSLAWRGLPLVVALLTASAAFAFIACDEDGPSPIGDHLPDDVDSGGGEEPAGEAGAEGSADAEVDAGEDADAGEEPKDAGKTDAGDGGKSKDAGDADADH